MNKTITNLSMIANAAEYFDRKTGAAWKIRGSLTNMLVWSANSLIYSLETGDAERIFNSRVELATLRCWMRDSNSSSFILDLTPTAIARTLGLERQIDIHKEAERIARNKCMLARSAARFAEYYKAAVAAAEEQRKVRESRVGLIADLVQDHGYPLSIADKDCMASFHGYDPRELGDAITDEELYDDESVERQRDTLNEVVGNALESMYEVCDYELTAAITTDKVNRLSAYKTAIEHMFQIVGVDTKKLAVRRAKLEAAVEAMAKQQDVSNKQLNDQIQGEITKLVDASKPEPAKKAPARRIKKEDLAKELGVQV